MMTLILKNKGIAIDPLHVNTGALINAGIGVTNDYKDLPFYMFPSNQDYSGTSNPANVDYTIPNIPNFNGVGPTPMQYNLEHRFLRTFDLGSHENTGDEFRFSILYFPYYLGEHSSRLDVSWVDTVGSERTLTINFIGKLLGNVSEVDQTIVPEMVLEMDYTNSGNMYFEFI
tara:strand:- start:8329 stop:8844 length:516 start_codon:yes stop_codon:yes gene_type:complete